MNNMHLIIDGLLLIFIVFIAALSAKKGFVCTLVEVVGFVAAIIFINAVTPTISNAIYDKAIEPSVLSTVENAVDFNELQFDAFEGVDDSTINTSSIENTFNTTIEKLPKILTQNNLFNFSKEEIINEITSQNINNDTDFAKLISTKVIKPTVINAISLIIQIILLTVLFILVRIIAKIVNKLFTFSIVGSLNKFLGGVIGVVKGGIIASLICLVISLIVSLTNNDFLFFTEETINSTYIFKTFINFSPFI